MARLAREGSRNQRLKRLVENCSLSAPDSRLDCWDGFIRSRFRFRDEYREILRTVEYSLSLLLDSPRRVIEGDCDCVSIFFGAGALALGYRVRFVATRTQYENPAYTHVYVEVLSEGYWRRFDQTVERSLVDQEIAFERIEEYL
jgi:hypothetical protein